MVRDPATWIPKTTFEMARYVSRGVGEEGEEEEFLLLLLLVVEELESERGKRV